MCDYNKRIQTEFWGV